MPIGFTLTPEQEELRLRAQEFAQRELRPIAAEVDERDQIPWELLRKMGQPPFDFIGSFIPKEYGGTGRGKLAICLIMEELAYESAVLSTFIEACALSCTPLLVAGSEEQKHRYLPPIARGEGVSCFALTEPHTGSDAAGLETRATRDGDGYVLNGHKTYASYADVARFLVVYAKTDPTAGGRGISAFIVPQGTPGMRIVNRVQCMGLRGHQDEDVEFEDCHVPQENRVGEEGRGLRYAMATLDDTRATLCGGYIGLAKAALDAAVKYAKERVAFGQPLFNFQGISFPLADIAAEIDAARLLAWRACWLGDQGVRHTKESSMAKLFSCEVVVKATNLAVQVFGGIGCTKRLPIERFYRDARIWTFAQGAPGIHRLIISRALFQGA
ncbi:MAG: acyl-CoA dehydrogenase family protein [Chloroflexi bacterium]|nr:acyl-CoA dehydrogenase family protein [Chloroflexota bacterium]